MCCAIYLVAVVDMLERVIDLLDENRAVALRKVCEKCCERFDCGRVGALDCVVDFDHHARRIDKLPSVSTTRPLGPLDGQCFHGPQSPSEGFDTKIEMIVQFVYRGTKQCLESREGKP